MSRSALIYARYSSELQNAASIEDQVRLCRERLDQDQIEVRDVFADRAISGSSLHTRAGIKALLDEVARGTVDIVIAEALDRLSRDQEDIARIYKRLSFAQVTLMTLAEGEINELHIPTGRPVKLTMTSEDVIHSFFVPAFRVKADAVPGRYTTVWFEATKAGRYHLFCTEYCGTQHSRMIGSVIAMDPYDYQAWLAGDVISTGGVAEMITPAERGRQLFVSTGCTACHAVDKASEASAEAMQGPSLVGLYGEKVELSDGSTVVADEGYLRTSILNPLSDIVAGYQPVMPPYATRLSEEDVLALIAYIRSLGAESDAGDEPVTADAGTSGTIAADPAESLNPSRPAPGTSMAGFPPLASDANPAAQIGATLDNSETKPGKAPTEKRP